MNKRNLNTLLRQMVPNVGTIIVVGVMLFVYQVWAAPESVQQIAPAAPNASSGFISYQGTLTDSNSAPINGNVEMVFGLYYEVEGGTPFWTESYTGTQAIEVTGGQFHVLLGSQTALNSADLVGNLYLGITVNGEKMLPRERFASIVVKELVVSGEGTSMIEGSLQIGDNSWTPEFADMYQNDLAVHGQFEQRGGSGARVYKLGIGVDPGTAEGTLKMGGDLNMEGNGINSIGDMDFGSSVGKKAYWYSNAYYTGIESSTLYEVSNRYFRWYDSSTGPDGGSSDVMQLDANSGSVWLKGDLTVSNYNIHLGGSGAGRVALRRDSSRILHLLPWGGASYDYDNVCIGCGSAAGLIVRGNVSCGALTEANLQTPDELTAERIDRFEEGDVLCWAGDRLEKCSAANDLLVQAVADVDGKPIVIGAEVIKVLGSVHYGDLLVASDMPGYAMVNNDPRPGSVIAQALENFSGEQGIIKAMIRKF